MLNQTILPIPFQNSNSIVLHFLYIMTNTLCGTRCNLLLYLESKSSDLPEPSPRRSNSASISPRINLFTLWLSWSAACLINSFRPLGIAMEIRSKLAVSHFLLPSFLASVYLRIASAPFILSSVSHHQSLNKCTFCIIGSLNNCAFFRLAFTY